MRLGSRELVPELMDAPDLDPRLHRQALAGLRRINWFCQTSARIAREIIRLANARALTSVRVLDLGCGSGDVAVDVAKRVSSSIPCCATGWDMSEVAIAAARERATSTPHTSSQRVKVQFEIANVFNIPECAQDEASPFDVVYCSLFLHHFNDSQSIQVLKAMQRLASVGVIVDDLCRTQLGLVLATVGCRLLSRSPIVHFDGPQSVRAAFTIEEMRSLAAQTGLTPFTMTKRWPERFTFAWERIST